MHTDTDPTNDPSRNIASSEEPPLLALAIGILPAGLPDHLVPKWGINAAGCTDEPGGSSEPERVLAIGPCGPAWFPLATAERATRASAENFNPSHDELGRFTTSGGVVAGHAGKEHLPDDGVRQFWLQADGQDQYHQRGERPAQRNGVVDPTKQEQSKVPEAKSYDGKLSSGAYKQAIATGHCLPAVMREAIAQLSKVQTDAVRMVLLKSAELYPDGTLQVPLPRLEQEIRKANPQYSYDFSGSAGADAEEGRSTLRAHGVDSQRIAVDQIPNHLNDGPVLVSAYDNGNPHAELIIGINKDGTYAVYNPLIRGGRGTLYAKDIIVRGFPRVYTLKPLKK